MYIAREYQSEAVRSVLTALRDFESVGVVMPTGSGKSYVECQIIEKLLDTMSFGEGIVVVSHLRDVVEQLADAFASISKYANNAFRLKGNDKPRIQSKIFFTTIQTLIGDRAKEFFSVGLTRKNIKFVLIDEAHAFGTESFDIMKRDIFPDAKVIGFSATPFRDNQFSFGQFATVAYAIDSQSLIDQGFLTEPKLKVMDIGEQGPAERLASVVRIFTTSERDRKMPAIVYLRSKLEAQEMKLVAEEAGIKCEFVSGESTEKFCRQLYSDARAGKVEMIANCRKLETGIDIPNIGSIFMPFPVKSVTSFLQRIGRALRPFPGKTFASIYVFGDSPSLKNGTWAKLQRDALKAKVKLDPIEKLVDDLEMLEEDGAPEERVHWTKEAIAACEALLQKDLRTVAELVAEKRFPQKYNRAIRNIVNRMEVKSGNVALASDAQISALVNFHGFKQEDCLRLSEREAASILVALEAYLHRDPFVLKHGPHAGKHIADTPPMYRRYIKDPVNKGLWLKWVKEGRPDETRDTADQA